MPKNNNKILYYKVARKIAPTKLIQSGKCTGTTGLFKFEENI